MSSQIGIVEDTDLVRQLLVDILSSRGYSVTGCGTLAEARDTFVPNAPDLLIMDVHLPDGDGIDFLAELRQIHGDLPVLVLSGLGGEEDLLRGFDAGAADYITKPVSRAELLAKCAVLLSRANKAQKEKPASGLPGGNMAAFGRYQIERILGQGGVGVVYEATDKQTNDRVALKVLSPLSCMKEECRKRFTREAYALSQVDNPQIVSVFDFGSAEGRMFCAMEYVKGPTLADKVKAEGPASEQDLVVLGRALAEILRTLNDADLVHRDLKPSNIILREGRFDSPVLVDFGLAKQTFDHSLTMTGSVVGTPAFMAPETIMGVELDASSDLFSLGLVLRFAATGANVFPGRSCLELLNSIASLPVPIPRHLSNPLREVMRRLTRINRTQRFASAADLATALDDLSSSELTSAA